MEPLPQQSHHFAIQEGVARSRERVLTQWLHNDKTPRAILDVDLNIQWINVAAEEMLSKNGTVLLQCGKIRPKEKKNVIQFKEFMSNVAYSGTSFCVKSLHSENHVIIIASRLPHPFSNYIYVTFRLSSFDLKVEITDLSTAFGLTRTESRVARYLLSGQTAEETARTMCVSLETTRTHIKRAYAKMGVSSREAFFNRLLPFIVFAS